MPAPKKLSLAECIENLEHEHRTASGLISQVKKICNDYKLPDDACITYRLFVTQLQELEADAHIHIMLADSVLHPRALALEKELRSNF